MRAPRHFWLASLFALALLAAPHRAAAQEAETGATTAEGEQTGEAAPDAEEAPAEGEAEAAPAEPSGPTPPPPVALLPITIGRVPAEVSALVRDTVAEQLRPHVHRREVVVLTDEEKVAAATACADAPCIGAIVAAEGAISGVLLRMERARPRDPLKVMIGVVDPVSGASHGEPVSVEIPREQLEAPQELLAPLTDALSSLMPPAPRHTTLLVASNVDEATVRVDDQEVGTTPIAPGNIAPGEHTVMVTRPGYLAQSQRIEVTAGQAARLNFDLEPTPETAAGDSADLSAGFGGGEAGGDTSGGGSLLSEWWFWAAVGGGAVVLGVLIGVIAAVASAGPGQEEAISVPPIVP